MILKPYIREIKNSTFEVCVVRSGHIQPHVLKGDLHSEALARTWMAGPECQAALQTLKVRAT